MKIVKQLTRELNITEKQVQNTIKLLDDGNTVPFIARYRKDVTEELDEVVLRNLSERLIYLRNLEEKRKEINRLIEEQGKLTEELKKDIENAESLQKLEDLYRPFRPKRKTRATVAIAQGLEPLARNILEGEGDLESLAKNYISEDKGIENITEAIQGAKDIIAENISDNAKYREWVRNTLINRSIIYTEENIKRKEKTDKDNTYKMYFDYNEPLKKLANHRVLAINRGEKENILKVKLEPLEENINEYLEKKIVNEDNNKNRNMILDIVKDSYKRLIFPSIEREIRNMYTEKAEEQAIEIFGKNLKQLLLQAPIKDKVVMGYDPGYRTGCKIAVVDGTGKLLDYGVIYPTKPQEQIEKAKNTMRKLIEKYSIDIIAIGNGTASRESEKVVAELIEELDRKVYYTIVSEAGASIYSASKVGTEEYPDIDVSIRGAISIATRLQDPLAELVKIEPKHIGIGQYQHDLNQPKLDKALTGVVEDSVNKVGVDLNTASVSLLSYVAGVSSSIAKNIYDYRNEIGRFTNRKELLKVKRLGKAAYTQCAGFLRITDGDNILDSTGVHPESYQSLMKLFKKLNLNLEKNEIKSYNFSDVEENIKNISEEIEIGEITLKDIIKELKKPGRDPRDEMPTPDFRTDVISMEELKVGMVMPGTIRNIVDFGAFVDIGVKQDGLLHISQISEKRIKHPIDVLSIGEKVQVKIIDLNIEEKRISLSMKNI